MTKYIYLAGGFGNNLFQISYGIYLESLGCNVIYKTALLKNNFFTRLFKWTIHKNELTELFLDGRMVDDHIDFFDLFFLLSLFVKKAIKRDNLYHAPCAKSSNRFFGYFVTGEHLNNEVFSILRSKLEAVKPKVVKLNECSIHLRRGDFAVHQRLANTYYIKAINRLSSIGSFNLLTDSPNEIETLKNETSLEIVPSASRSMKNDFFEMYNSKRIIMSNSTFCYWAAVLGESEYVIYPSYIAKDVDWVFYINKDSEMLDASFESEK